jgi:hypothetical protein
VWRDLTPVAGEAPEARRHGTAIYDPVGGRVVIFGGAGMRGELNDVWALDLLTATWSRLEPRGRGPAPRLGHNAVYDAQGHQMVVWAGQRGQEFFDDTWILDLTQLTWHDVSPKRRPRARYGSASVYDPFERSLVQFAGFTDIERRFQDTQAFDLDAHRWEDLTPPADLPEVRCLLTAAFDPLLRRMIIYSGQRDGPLGDLWAFDLGSRSWTNLTVEERPAGRFFATSFLGRDGRFYVFGGRTSEGDVNETWSFDFTTSRWTLLALDGAPSPRNGMMGAYIEDEDRFIVFGGTADERLFAETWELATLAASP